MGLESGIHRDEAYEAPDHQPGTDGERQRERELGDSEPCTKAAPLTARAELGGRFQRPLERLVRHRKCRYQPREDPGANSCEQRKQEDSGI